MFNQNEKKNGKNLWKLPILLSINSTTFKKKKINWKKLYDIHHKNYQLFKNKDFFEVFSKYEKSSFSKNNCNVRSFRRMACKKLESKNALKKLNLNNGRKKYLKLKNCQNSHFLNFKKKTSKNKSIDIFNFRKIKNNDLLTDRPKKYFFEFLQLKRLYFEKNKNFVNKLTKISNHLKKKIIYKRSFSDSKIEKKIFYFPKFKKLYYNLLIKNQIAKLLRKKNKNRKINTIFGELENLEFKKLDKIIKKVFKEKKKKKTKFSFSTILGKKNLRNSLIKLRKNYPKFLLKKSNTSFKKINFEEKFKRNYFSDFVNKLNSSETSDSKISRKNNVTNSEKKKNQKIT